MNWVVALGMRSVVAVVEFLLGSMAARRTKKMRICLLNPLSMSL